jgi:hypothetical protein
LRSIFFAISSSSERISPPRGPRSVLCVVVVTTWACGKGEGWTPVATRPANDQLRPALAGDRRDGVVVEPLGLRIEVVVDDVEERSREVDLEAVAQVTTGLDGQREDRVTRLEQGHERGDVRVGAGVRLHVGEPALEQLLGAIAGEVFDGVVVDAAAVVALARIPLGVLVGHPRSDGVHHHRRDVVLRGDELQRGRLPLRLGAEDLRHVRVMPLEQLEQAGGQRMKRDGRCGR